jgi:hypothetical protein
MDEALQQRLLSSFSLQPLVQGRQRWGTHASSPRPVGARVRRLPGEGGGDIQAGGLQASEHGVGFVAAAGGVRWCCNSCCGVGRGGGAEAGAMRQPG